MPDLELRAAQAADAARAAEDALLGSILAWPERDTELVADLTPDDFTTGWRRGLFSLIRSFHKTGKIATRSAVVDEGYRRGTPLEYWLPDGDVLKLVNLPAHRSIGVPDLIAKVRLNADGRRLGALLQEGLSRLARGDDPAEVRAAVSKPYGVGIDKAPRLGTIIGDAFDRMTARAAGEEARIPLPWEDLTRAAGGGLRPGAYFLVAPPKMGKTQLALQIAHHAADNGVPVLYAALELDKVGIVARLASIAADTGTSKPPPRWSDLDWSTGEDASRRIAAVRARVAERLSQLPFHVVTADAAGWHAGALQREIRGVLREHGGDTGQPSRVMPDGSSATTPILVVVDFLQLIGAEVDARGQVINLDDRELRGRIRRASYVINDATRDGRVVVLAVSAMARGTYEDAYLDVHTAMPDPASFVGLGKESGEIEYAATAVWTLHAERGSEGANRRRWLAVAASRHGSALPWVPLTWDVDRYETADKHRLDTAEKLARGDVLTPAGETPKKRKAMANNDGSRKIDLTKDAAARGLA